MKKLISIMRERKFVIYEDIDDRYPEAITWFIYGFRQTINLFPICFILLFIYSSPLISLIVVPEIILNVFFFVFYPKRFNIEAGFCIMFYFFVCLHLSITFSFQHSGSLLLYVFIGLSPLLTPIFIGFLCAEMSSMMGLHFNYLVLDKLDNKIKKVKKKRILEKHLNYEVNITEKYISNEGIDLQKELSILFKSIENETIKEKRSDDLYVILPAISELLAIKNSSSYLEIRNEAKENLDSILVKLKSRNITFSRNTEKEIIEINKKLIDNIK